MTKDWIKLNLPLDQNGRVLLQSFSDGGTITISPEHLEGLTSTVPEDKASHNALSVLSIAKDGWQKYFDDWKDLGIIS